MRVLLAPEGSRGDVQPLVALGAALRREGCEVRMAASPDARALAESHGLAFHVLPQDNRAFIEEHAGAIHGGPVAMQRAMQIWLSRAMEHQFDTLLALAADADLLVGGGIQLGAPSAAEAAGIPYRFVAYCPILFPSGAHPPFVLERRIGRPWLNRFLWRVFLGGYGWLLSGELNRRRAALGLEPVRDVYRYLCGERPLLAADPDLAPLPGDVDVTCDTVGFLHPPASGAPLPEKLEAFLAAGDPPVYVGFGSMPDPQPERTTRTLLDALRRVGARGVIGAGWAGLGEVPLDDDVMVIESGDHAALFPRMAAVVHHGGAGTTSTAARAGVAQVVVPHILDQFYWTDRVARCGIGASGPRRSRLTAERLGDVLAAVLDNEIVETRAAEQGERMRARDPHGRALEHLFGAVR